VSPPVLILRAQPAADATAERARAAGLVPLVHPLFALRAVAWAVPDSQATALLLTSANAVRLAGPLPDGVARLPAFAVGPATAAAARAAGLTVAFEGASDGAEAVRAAAAAGHRLAVHLRGEVARPLPGDLCLLPLVTYAADALEGPLPDGLNGGVALLHSPRAAALFAGRVAAAPTRRPTPRSSLAIVAISAAAADAAGPGWRRVEVAKRPSDGAMIRAAAQLLVDRDP